jgi:hypothetical protein
VRKVRLVADGRQHKVHGPTYAATPSREELFFLLHMFATNDMDYYFTDEHRAFLSADRTDKNLIFAKFSGDPKFYEIVNALYGMKTASRDHQQGVCKKLESLGFQRMEMCSCIYKSEGDGYLILVYVYVDDFIFGGTCNDGNLSKIAAFRQLAQTSEPELNAPVLLGMEIVRDKEKRIILVSMKKKIGELCAKYSRAIMKNPGEQYPDGVLKKRTVPMPTTGYVVHEHELDKLPEDKRRFLTSSEMEVYMSIVGVLIWIQGVRFDIIFTVLYLSWFTKKPRKHHMDMAEYCIGYLANTIEIPLVLGGKGSMRIIGYTDASLATGPQSRTITGEIIKLNDEAGAIYAKATAGHSVPLSSFEGELDGTTRVFKSVARASNITSQIGCEVQKPSLVYSDNEAMIRFVRGEGVARGVRHMEMRMYYTREEYKKGNIVLEHMLGTKIPTDKMTKLGATVEHRCYTRQVQGLDMVGPDYLIDIT